MKILYVYLLVVPLLYGNPTITSDSVPPIVLQGGTHNFTATCTGGCTWSLTTGSAGSINSSTGVFTAPPHVTVNQSIDGCQLLTPDHSYNAPINSLAVRPESSTWVGYITTLGRALSLTPSALPVNILSNLTPSYQFSFAYTSANNGPYQVPNNSDLKLQGGINTLAGGDLHYIGIRPDTCNITEIYEYGSNNASTNPTLYPTASGGLLYNSINGAIPAGATNASGGYMLPAMLKATEIQKALATGATVIPHMINITLSNYGELCVANGSAPPDWPASTIAGIYCTPARIPYGARFRLNAAYTYGGSNPVTAILINTMKQYGFFVSDGGYSMDAYGLDGDIYTYDMQRALNELGQLFTGPNESNFEFVNFTQLAPSTKTGPQSGLVDTTAASGLGYTIPQFAEVVVTDTVGSTKMRVLLQGATLDFERAQWNFQAGSNAFTLPYHLTGVAAGVNCGISPPVGSINASTCAYTPPATVATPTTVTVTITSTADATLKTQATLLVFPSGTLGILTAYSSTSFTDSQSQVWWNGSPYYYYSTPNVAIIPAFSENYVIGQTVYQNAPTSLTDYQTYGWGLHPQGDTLFEIQVLPGTYQVQYRSITVTGNNTVRLEVQGNPVYPYLNLNDFTVPTGSPISLVSPATVDSSGTLRVYLRRITSQLMGSILIKPITCPGAPTTALPYTPWWPSGVVGGASQTSIDPCAAPVSLITNPWALFPMPSGASK